MIYLIDGSNLNRDEAGRLIEHNEKMQYVFEFGSELGIIWHVVSPFGNMIKTNDSESTEAKQLFEKICAGSSVVYSGGLQLFNDDNIEDVNKEIDKVFWKRFEKKAKKSFGFSSKQTKDILHRLKDDSTTDDETMSYLKKMSENMKKDFSL